MNKIFKFWLSKINKKTRLNADEKIGYLANELIKELKASGRSIQCKNTDKSFGSLMIWVHHLDDDENSKIVMQNKSNGWEIDFKPTFNEF